MDCRTGSDPMDSMVLGMNFRRKQGEDRVIDASSITQGFLEVLEVGARDDVRVTIGCRVSC